MSFNLPQTDLPRIQARQKTSKGLVATVNLQDQGGEQLQAPVDFVSNAVNNTSGTIELRATFQRMTCALVPGQLVNVTVQLNDIPDAMVVPREAVNDGPDGQYVYVVDAEHRGRAARREGAVRRWHQHRDRQATSSPVTMVITDGQLRAGAGGKVTVARGGPNAQRRGGPAGRAAARKDA